MSDDQPEMVTRPMIETLLSRIDSLEARLGAKFSEALAATTMRFEQIIGGLHTEIGGLHTEIGGLHTEIGGLRNEIGGLHTQIGGLRNEIRALRTETNENFSRVRDEIAILNEDTLKTRAGQRELLRRVEQLESKVS